MQLLSNLGDIAVLLPASLGLIVFLAWFRLRQDAAAYAAAAAACLAVALLAKLAFAVCDGKYSVFGVESPSGHAAFAATFYGCLAALLGAGRTIGWRLALYSGAAALILLIGASRVALEAHNVPEVAVGVLIGAVSIALFNILRGKSERLELSARTIVQMSPFVGLYALCLLLLAGHCSAEPFIDSVAALAGAEIHLCR